MIYVTITSLVVTALTVSGGSALVRSLIRQHARERELLVNQLCHLSGRTWTLPPAREEREEASPLATVGSPEQWPDGYDFEADS